MLKSFKYLNSNFLSQKLGPSLLTQSIVQNGPFVTIKRLLTILGIETSCDDTGCAIVDDKGQILGESLCSQQETHLEHGGIIPPVARDLHKDAIQRVVKNTLQAANMDLADVDAIATTLKPGLPLSLLVGMQYGKYLSKTSKKPFIPVHHMEAHALTIRMVENVEFPFLVLLISGGHSLLAVAQSATEFLTLGKSLDDAPGEAMDKTARRLKLRNIAEFRSLSGGQAVELAASRGDPTAYEFGIPLTQCRDCNFSFSAFKNNIYRILLKEEKAYEVTGGQTLPRSVISNVCASMQRAVTTHICHRVQRAVEYVRLKNIIPPDKQTLVVSGGVACNQYIGQALRVVCRELGYEVRVPPPRLCTDNGIMIAWNGVERWRAGQGVYEHHNLDCLDIESKCPLGEDISQDVVESNIRCRYKKLTDLILKQNTQEKTKGAQESC